MKNVFFFSCLSFLISAPTFAQNQNSQEQMRKAPSAELRNGSENRMKKPRGGDEMRDVNNKNTQMPPRDEARGDKNEMRGDNDGLDDRRERRREMMKSLTPEQRKQAKEEIQRHHLEMQKITGQK
jgi:hypothetical protein